MRVQWRCCAASRSLCLLAAVLCCAVSPRQTSVLTDPAASAANAKCCVTFVQAGGKQLNLEALSAEQCNAFLAGINSVLTGNGLQVVLEESKTVSETANAGKTKSKRFSIMASSIAGLPKTAHETVMGLNVNKRQSLLHLSTSDTISMMTDGRRFYRYFTSGLGGGVHKELVTVFFVKEKNGQRASSCARCALQPHCGAQPPARPLTLAVCLRVCLCVLRVQRSSGALPAAASSPTLSRSTSGS
jgi:hypothetical protein